MNSIQYTRFAAVFFGMLSPLLLIINALRAKGFKRQWFLIIFIIFYGVTADFPDDSDATRHLQSINDYYLNMSFTKFLEVSGQILMLNPPDGYQDDIFIHILSFLSGLVGWPRMLYLIVSGIYGYLFVKSLLIVLKSLDLRRGGFILLFSVLLFFFWKNIEGINSIRNHTGAWFLFYMTMRYIGTKDRKYFLAIFFTPMIHFQYLMMLPVVFLGLIIKLSSKLLIAVFVASFFIQIPMSYLTDRVQNTELGKSKVKAYVKDQDYVVRRSELKSEGQHIYTRVAADGTMYKVMGVLVLVLLSYYNKNRSRHIEILATIGVLLCSVANLFESVPSIYSRVYQNGGLYVLSGLIMIQNNIVLDVGAKFLDWTRKITIMLLALPSSLFVLFKLSQLAGYISVFIFGSPLILLVDEYVNLSLKEFISFLI